MLNVDFPSQKRSDKMKNKSWKEDCVRWLSEFSTLNSSPIRKDIVQKRINYNLYSGILDMEDLMSVINPTEILETNEKTIKHYPVLNKKLELLLGEEKSYPFDKNFSVTNHNAISKKEKEKKKLIEEEFINILSSENLSEEEYMNEMERIKIYYNYEYQDIREIRANCIANHYYNKYNMPLIFQSGFLDMMICNEEIYRCYLNHGIPKLEKLNPENVHVLKSGYSNKVEDADMIIIEDYWQPGRIIDEFSESLTSSQITQIEEYNNEIYKGENRENDFVFSRDLANLTNMKLRIVGEDRLLQFADGINVNSLPYDIYGNIRVLRVFWKSLRMIKKISSYDVNTGEEHIDYVTQEYIADKSKGEEEEKIWINEAWQGVMIGSGEDAIIIDVKPCPIQYNNINNPSKCHFGIIGTIYSVNDKPRMSMLDILKNYNYMYDVTMDRLNQAMARNLGKLAVLDWSKKPKDMDSEYWVAFAKRFGVAIINNFNEAEQGKNVGMLAGAYQHTPVMDADNSGYIQYLLNTLYSLETQMGIAVGITPQREGQVQNRETYNGIERSIKQSSNITSDIFDTHNDVKKRVMECFVDTAKFGLKGTNEEYEYILPDSSKIILNIDGDEFCENDYGICSNVSEDSKTLQQNIATLAHAALQNQTLSFSTIMELFASSSIAEKRRIIEREEKLKKQQEQKNFQQQQEQIERKTEADMRMKLMELEADEKRNIRDNETKILMAQISAGNTVSEDDSLQASIEDFNKEKEKLKEKQYEFDKKHLLNKEKLELDREKLRLQSNRS